MKPNALPLTGMARSLRQVANSPVTLAVVAMVLVVQLAIVLSGGLSDGRVLRVFLAFGLSREGFLAGEVWRIFTYGILHGNGLHAGVNALFLLALGCRVEHIAGRGNLLKVLIAGILGGGLGQLLLAPGGDESALLVGMSGAGLALLLFITTLSPESRMMPIPVSGRSLGLGILVAELVFVLIDPGFGVPVFSRLGQILVDRGMGAWFQIGHGCHMGGWFAGWLLGRWVLRPRITQESLRRERARREALSDRRGSEK